MAKKRKWIVNMPAFYGTGYTVEAKTKEEAIEKATEMADYGESRGKFQVTDDEI